MPRATHVRQRILDLASEAIDEGGEAAVRVNDLAEAAGVTVPTLYRHFGSRDGLVQAAQTQRFRQTQFTDAAVLAAALGKCTSQDDLKNALRQELETHFERDRWSMRQVRLNALGSGYARVDLTTSLASAQRQTAIAIADMLDPFQEKGWIRQDVDLLASAYWFMGQILGRVLIELGDQPVRESAWNAVSIEAVMSVLFGPDERRARRKTATKP